MKKRDKTSGQIICQLFSLQKYQTIYQDYSCSYFQTIFFFGRLYIGEDHFCFNSNMFGISKRFSIRIDSFRDITLNQVKNTIHCTDKNDKDYTFANFVNANNVYKLMYALWKGERIEAKLVANDQELDNNSKQTSVDRSFGQSNVQSNFFNPETSKDEKQTIAEIIFPCSVQQYYDFFLSDKASIYGEKNHFQTKLAESINVSEWKKNQQLKRQVREITASIKVSGVPLRNRATLHKVQSLQKSEIGELDLYVVSQITDLPYSSYFTCDQHLSIRAFDQKRCKLKVQAWVSFNKSTYMKSTIKDRTLKDLKSDYELWLKIVSQKLEKLKKQNVVKEQKQERSFEYEKVQNTKIQFSQEQKKEVSTIKVKENRSQLNRIQKKINILIIVMTVLVILNAIQLYS